MTHWDEAKDWQEEFDKRAWKKLNDMAAKGCILIGPLLNAWLKAKGSITYTDTHMFNSYLVCSPKLCNFDIINDKRTGRGHLTYRNVRVEVGA